MPRKTSSKPADSSAPGTMPPNQPGQGGIRRALIEVDLVRALKGGA